MNRRDLFMGAGAALALSGTAAAAALAEPDALVFRKAIEVDALKRLHDRAFDVHSEAEDYCCRNRGDEAALEKRDALWQVVLGALHTYDEALYEFGEMPVVSFAGLRCKAELYKRDQGADMLADFIARDVLTLERAS